jgi:hypothetical protein
LAAEALDGCGAEKIGKDKYWIMRYSTELRGGVMECGVSVMYPNGYGSFLITAMEPRNLDYKYRV